MGRDEGGKSIAHVLSTTHWRTVAFASQGDNSTFLMEMCGGSKSSDVDEGLNLAIGVRMRKSGRRRAGV